MVIFLHKWKKLITHYYRDNHLIGEYFQGVDENQPKITSVQEKKTKKPELDVSSFLPSVFNPGDGLRIYIYYDKIIQVPKEDIIIIPTTYTIIENKKCDTIEYDTNTLLKMMKRNGLNVGCYDYAEVIYEDIVINYPHFQCRNDKAVNALMNSLLQLYRAMSADLSDALFSCSFSINVNSSESVVVSFVGNIVDFITIFDKITIPFSAKEHIMWLKEVYDCNSQFKTGNLNPNPFSMIANKGLKIKRVDVPRTIINGIEINQGNILFDIEKRLNTAVGLILPKSNLM